MVLLVLDDTAKNTIGSKAEFFASLVESFYGITNDANSQTFSSFYLVWCGGFFEVFADQREFYCKLL